MKKLFVLILLVFTFAIAQSKSKGFKRYNVKSGKVIYKMSGMQKGTEILYWDNYGKREARYTESTMSIFGMEKNTKQLVILDGIWSYTVNYENKTVTKTSIEDLKKLIKGNNLQNYGKEFLENNGEKIGSGTILDKKCDIWNIQNLSSKLWIWNSIPLKSETKMIFEITLTATELKINTEIPENKFAYPKDFELINAEK